MTEPMKEISKHSITSAVSMPRSGGGHAAAGAGAREKEKKNKRNLKEERHAP